MTQKITPQPRKQREKSTSAASAKPHDAELIAAASEYLAEKELSQNDFAKEIGMSGAAVSQWLNGIYPGNVFELEELVRSVVLRSKLASLPAMTNIVATEAVLDVCGMLSRIARTRTVAVIHGLNGCGKSAAVTHYALAVDKTAILLQLNRWSGSIQGVEGQFMAHFSKKAWQKSGQSRGEYIREQLSGHGRTLIVDGADNLTGNARNWLLDMASATGSALAFVCGPNGDKFARSDAKAAAAVGAVVAMKPDADDALAILSALAGDCPEMGASLPALADVGATRGVGKAAQLVALALDMARNSLTPPTLAVALDRSACLCGVGAFSVANSGLTGIKANT